MRFTKFEHKQIVQELGATKYMFQFSLDSGAWWDMHQLQIEDPKEIALFEIRKYNWSYCAQKMTRMAVNYRNSCTVMTTTTANTIMGEQRGLK